MPIIRNLVTIINKLTVMKKLISVLVFLGVFSIYSFGQSFVAPTSRSDIGLVRSFLIDEMVYPEEELTSNIQGTVEVSFTVDKDGNAHHFEIAKGLSPALDREALRLIRLIVWRPASSNGTVISAPHSFEIKFNIRQYLKRLKQEAGKPIVQFDTDADTSYRIVNFASLDVAPTPIIAGGKMQVNNYIQKQLRYPEAAFRLNLSGTVTIGFVVETDGHVSNIHVIQSLGGGCDQEAIRIIQSIHWTPGLKDDQRVRCDNKLDISFMLNDESKGNYIPNRQENGI